MKPMGIRKTVKSPYFSLIGKSLDEVMEMLDEIKTSPFQLTECICI